MGPFQSDPHEQDDERFEGRRFPSEAEWLHFTDPVGSNTVSGSTDEPAISEDFVERTLRAVREDLTTGAGTRAPAAQDDGADGDLPHDGTALDRALAAAPLPADLLRSLVPPDPTADFVDRTVVAVHSDRRARWHELLARHVAPDPSPEFVARTLSSLVTERRRSVANEPGTLIGPRHRSWTHLWPLLAIAAAMLFWFAPWTQPPAPLELRLARSGPAAFASSYAATPLPALLTSLSHAADPGALDDGGADGVWLLLGRKP